MPGRCCRDLGTARLSRSRRRGARGVPRSRGCHCRLAGNKPLLLYPALLPTCVLLDLMLSVLALSSAPQAVFLKGKILRGIPLCFVQFRPLAKLHLQLHKGSNLSQVGSAAELVLVESPPCHGQLPPPTQQCGRAGGAGGGRPPVRLSCGVLSVPCCRAAPSGSTASDSAEHPRSCRVAWGPLAAGRRTKRNSNWREKGQGMILTFSRSQLGG